MKNKNFVLTLVLIGFVVGITAFIFSNSMANGAESSQFSSSIIDLFFLRKLLDNELVVLIVRKAAHIIEFAGLGFFVMGLALHSWKCYQKPLYGMSFFYVLSVAVIDEHIQKFSEGRTSSTTDILLDFFGSIIGFVIVYLIYIIIVRSKKGKSCEE